MLKRSTILVGLVLASGFAMAAQVPTRKVLSGAEIKKTLVGKVATDGHHWTYHFKADGGLDAVEMGRARQGRWSIKNKQLCLMVPVGAPEDCVEVVREGKGLVFRANGLDLADVTVEPYRSKQQLQ